MRLNKINALAFDEREALNEDETSQEDVMGD